jgi:Flp pilus assembly protein TadG
MCFKRLWSKAAPGPRRNSERGGAIVEAAFLVPWLFFLFVGVLDVGFFYYDLMAVNNAARVAALNVSGGSSCTSATNPTCFAIACPVVLSEIQSLPGATGLSACTNGTTVTIASPVAVSVSTKAADTADCPNGGTGNTKYSVTASYLTIPMVPIPGLLAGQLTIAIPVQVCGTS